MKLSSAFAAFGLMQSIPEDAEASAEETIRTVRGAGYAFDETFTG
ncbi:MAG: hypothetical protein ACOYLL_08775 [Beijerinckiaceae bacterium]